MGITVRIETCQDNFFLSFGYRRKGLELLLDFYCYAWLSAFPVLATKVLQVGK